MLNKTNYIYFKILAKSGVNMITLDKDTINNLSEGQKIADIQAATGNQVKVYGNGNDTVYGFYDENGKQIYINAASGATINTETFVNTYGHETGHIYTKNEAITSNSGNYAESIYALSNFLSGDSINTSGKATTGSWMVDQLSDKTSAGMLIGNTISANTVNKSDRDNLTMYLEGTDLTGTRDKEKSAEHSLEMANEAAKTHTDTSGNLATIYWDGDNTKEGRTELAYALLDFVNNYDFAEGEPLNIVAHSHGGNAVIQFTNLYDFASNVINFAQATGTNIGNQSYNDKVVNYKKIDNVDLLGTPYRSDYKFNYNTMASDGNVNAISDVNDTMVQGSIGGTDTKSISKIMNFSTNYKFLNYSIIPISNPLNPSQTMEGANNITINQFPNGSKFPGDIQYNSHTGLNTVETWKNYVDPAIKKSVNKGN